MPAILSSVVRAIDPTSAVADFAPFMAGNLVTMTSTNYQKMVQANDDLVDIKL
jgi:hypothetical protein